MDVRGPIRTFGWYGLQQDPAVQMTMTSAERVGQRNALLDEVEREITKVSMQLHALTCRRHALLDAATRLRLGESSTLVAPRLNCSEGAPDEKPR